MRIFLVALLTIILLGCASTQNTTDLDAMQANANDQDSVDLGNVQVVNPQYFLSYLDQIQIALGEGKPRELSEREADTVGRLADELREMLAGVENIKAMSPDDQHDVFNTTQQLWATIHEVDHDQVVCRRQHRVGTHMKQTHCRTVRQMRNDRNRYMEFIRESYYSPWTPPEGIL